MLYNFALKASSKYNFATEYQFPGHKESYKIKLWSQAHIPPCLLRKRNKFFCSQINLKLTKNTVEKLLLNNDKNRSLNKFNRAIQLFFSNTKFVIEIPKMLWHGTDEGENEFNGMGDSLFRDEEWVQNSP